MSKDSKTELSVVVPVYNEAAGLGSFHQRLCQVVEQETKNSYEIIYVDDGSTDNSAEKIRSFAKTNPHTKLLKLSRNFGKEIATTAGVNNAYGQAIIILDGDGQHPPELITDFMERWHKGSKVVIGLRAYDPKEKFFKRLGSKIFYRIFNTITGVHLMPGSTDFRLIDKAVQSDFSRMTERNRITRGLIDWLGYKRDYVNFTAPARADGQPSYSFKKLVKLAVDSVVSLSLSPLYISAYIGALVLPLSSIVGLFMVLNAAFGDPLNLHATGSAYLTVLILFLIGILLVSQGIIGLYLSHIHTETQNRPLYIIDKENSSDFENS